MNRLTLGEKLQNQTTTNASTSHPKFEQQQQCQITEEKGEEENETKIFVDEGFREQKPMVFYSFTPQQTSNYRFELFDNFGLIDVFSGDCSAPQSIASFCFLPPPSSSSSFGEDEEKGERGEDQEEPEGVLLKKKVTYLIAVQIFGSFFFIFFTGTHPLVFSLSFLSFSLSLSLLPSFFVSHFSFYFFFKIRSHEAHSKWVFWYFSYINRNK